MDNFAKEYFKKLKGLAHDFKSRRKELAESRIKMFVASLCRQLIEFKENYDIVLGSGNSGLFMTKIAEMTYQYLNIKTPPILNLPVYRFKEDGKTLDDNFFLIPQVKEKIQNINPINNVLFVDDEIMRGLTANTYFNLILQANPNINHINATIIAENHFFEWHYKMPKISICFFSYSPLIQDLNGNIGHFLPEDFFEEIFSLIEGGVTHNQAMAIIIGGGLKKKDNNGNPYFDFEIEKKLKNKIAYYNDIKSSLMIRLEELVKDGIKKYETGKIKFRF